jgi:hypothetical protein
MFDGPSPDIDREVRSILRTALSIYNVDVEMITRLKPTHIITQSQCAVCAVSTEELHNALCDCFGMGDIGCGGVGIGSVAERYQIEG